ncbi:glycosyltransferase [Sphaerisporangium album]|nr:glycosyltransferase [Sphaerisporangium album]
MSEELESTRRALEAAVAAASGAAELTRLLADYQERLAAAAASEAEALTRLKETEARLKSVERQATQLAKNLAEQKYQTEVALWRLESVQESRWSKLGDAIHTKKPGEVARTLRSPINKRPAPKRSDFAPTPLAAPPPVESVVPTTAGPAVSAPLAEGFVVPKGPLTRPYLTVAAIVDRRSEALFRYEWRQVTNFGPDNWEAMLDQHRPHLLFVESVKPGPLQGNGGRWLEELAGRTRGLRDLVEECGRRGIRTVFWHSGGPVSASVPMASYFDHVLATSEARAREWRAALRHDRVAVLPVATQPRVHNQIPAAEGRKAIALLGTAVQGTLPADFPKSYLPTPTTAAATPSAGATAPGANQTAGAPPSVGAVVPTTGAAPTAGAVSPSAGAVTPSAGAAPSVGAVPSVGVAVPAVGATPSPGGPTAVTGQTAPAPLREGQVPHPGPNKTSDEGGHQPGAAYGGISSGTAGGAGRTGSSAVPGAGAARPGVRKTADEGGPRPLSAYGGDVPVVAPWGPLITSKATYDDLLTAYRSAALVLAGPDADARTIEELSACGTPIMQLAAPIATDEESLRRALASVQEYLVAEDQSAAEAHLAWRATISVTPLLDPIIATAGLPSIRNAASIAAITAVSDPTELDRVLAQLHRQAHAPGQLVIVAEGMDAATVEKSARAVHRGDVIVRETGAPATRGAALDRALRLADGDLVAVLDPRDLYGEYYLADLVRYFAAVDAEIIGKSSYYAHIPGTGATLLRGPGTEHRFLPELAGATLLARRPTLTDLGIPDVSDEWDETLMRQCRTDGIRVYSADRYSYVRVPPAANERLLSSSHLQGYTPAEPLAMI